MKRQKMYRYGAVLIFIGVIIGFLVSANLGIMNKTKADDITGNVKSTVSTTENIDIQSSVAIQQLSNAFADVASKVNPSVVTVFTETIVKQRSHPFFQFPFEEFFGEDFQKYFRSPQTPEREQKHYGLGSGVIMSSDGIIITNNHVIDGADNIKIRLIDGTEHAAEIKGTDASTDLAIIKIKVENLPAIKFGDSDIARVGEWVLAIGSPLSPELAHTVTSGIISAKGRSGIFDPRQYEDFIQTDAAINPGNSGGALVNLQGELIGINTAIASRTGGFMGIGFAIPSNLANKVMTDILDKGRVVRGWLGVYIQDLTEELSQALGMENTNGVLVSSVQENSPAEKAGLKSEDVILTLNNKKVKNSNELRNIVASTGPNVEVTLGIMRAGKEKNVKVLLGELPEDQKVQPASTTSQVQKNIGIEVANVNSTLIERYDLKVKKDAVVITDIARGTIAAESGLRAGDVILTINKKAVTSVSDYSKLLNEVEEGDTLLFYIQRGDAKIFIAFTIPKE